MNEFSSVCFLLGSIPPGNKAGILCKTSCSCLQLHQYRIQDANLEREMPESISVIVFDLWKCQEVLREKLIPGRMKALCKSRSLDCCFWSRYVVSDVWLGSHTDAGTADVEAVYNIGLSW